MNLSFRSGFGRAGLAAITERVALRMNEPKVCLQATAKRAAEDEERREEARLKAEQETLRRRYEEEHVAVAAEAKAATVRMITPSLARSPCITTVVYCLCSPEA